MKARLIFSNVSRLSLLLIIAISFTPFFSTGTAAPSSSYYYKFEVDKNGSTSINVGFESSDTTGSSWVFVPKFSSWSRSVTVGSITQHQTTETDQVADQDYYFYQAFQFSFKSSAGSFKMNIQFSMSTGALIIEPSGMFFSPQIGFKPDSTGRAEVFFPTGYRVKEAVASGRSNYSPTQMSDNSVSFNPLQENIMRLQVEFSSDVSTPDLTTINQGVFSFKTVKRYENYASDILSVFNSVYSNLTRLFNVSLTSVEVRFFIPDFDTLLSVGGYIPFSGGKLGEININIFFVRAVNGTIEAIAVHELVHHFVWEARLSPNDLLWFHEGMAEFVSIETVDTLGYEGAQYERERLEQAAAQLDGKFGFVQEWSPDYPLPPNVGSYYAASYYVVNALAQMYGGSDFYRRFFELIQNVTVSDNSLLAYYLSKTANASVALVLRRWGFSLSDLYTSPLLIDEAEKALAELSPIFQPYKFLAEFLFRQALLSFEMGNVERANAFLQLAIFIAYVAPLLTLVTIVALLLVVIYILYRYRTKTTPTAQPSSTTMETVG